jgi:hypothetical protein
MDGSPDLAGGPETVVFFTTLPPTVQRLGRNETGRSACALAVIAAAKAGGAGHCGAT